MADCIVLHAADDVAIVTRRLVQGADPLGLAPLDAALAPGHKIARRAIATGAPVHKFGQVIGVAARDIAAGAHVHSHNLIMADHATDGAIGTALDAARAAIPSLPPRTFMGYARADGRVGTRNSIALCATVNCSATVIRRAAAELLSEGALDAYPHVDTICAFAHGTGCGMATDTDGGRILEAVLWGHATHPNIGAAIFVGLGCEVMQVARMRSRTGDADTQHFHFLTIQDSGGTRATIDAIKAHVRDLLPQVNAARRTPCPVSALTVALQCGGSDGLSGVTANPALGLASDAIVALGGTAILAETPEIFGAEQLLLSRTDAVTGAALRARLDWWADYTGRHGATLDNNPSPGNKLGGLTTILEKSLGAVAKGGSTPLACVCAYAAPPATRGLVFMDSPGFDPVSVTGQIAGGAQVVCFTTGRGSAFGSKPAPTIKIATNDALMASMPDDMDIGCGDVLRGVPLADKGAEILDAILAVASGVRTKSETLGLGDDEFVPWQMGAVL